MKGARLVQQTQVIRAMQAVQLGIQEELKPSDSAVYGAETNNSCFLHEAGTSESPNWIAKPWNRWETVMSCKASFARLMDSSYVLCFLLDKEFHQAHLQSSWVWLFGSLGTTVSIVIFISYHPFHCFEVTSQEDKDQPHTSLARAVRKNQQYVVLYPKRQAPKHYKVHFGSHRPSHNMAGKNAKICMWCPSDGLSSI